MASIPQLIKTWGIALTGGVATGKSTVAAMLRRYGYLVIDADQVSRDVTAPGTTGLAAVVKRFGPAVLTATGELDRKKLGAIVFADKAARADLEALTHPLIRDALGTALTRLDFARLPRPFFYEASLIFEVGRNEEFRAVWATVCDPATQLQRLMERNDMAREAAERVIASQMPAAEKAGKATERIVTDGSLQDVESQLNRLLKTLPSAPP